MNCVPIREMVTVLVAAGFLLVLGLTPGLPGLVRKIQDDLENFRAAIAQTTPRPLFRPEEDLQRYPGQIWFAVAGAALLALSLLALLTQ